MSQPLVIIGTGLAGYTLARIWRKLDVDTALMMLTTDHAGYYSKPMLSTALTKQQTPESLIVKSKQQMAEELNAEILDHTQVQAIDTDHSVVKLANQSIEFSQLVLAVGANPLRCGHIVDPGNIIYSVNHHTDYSAFRAALPGKKSIAIIGSGLVGSELANDLINQNLEVHVFSFESWPLERFVPEPVGRLLQKQLAALGVHYHMQQSVDAVIKSGETIELQAGDESFGVDLVVSAIGIKPNIDLATQAGLNINQGIVVDDYLQTSQPNIFALGDCMELNAQVKPFVLPINFAAQALAKTLVGDKTPLKFPLMPITVKMPAHPVCILPVPANVDGEWQCEVNDQGSVARFMDHKKQLRGFVLSGDQITRRAEMLKDVI